MLATDWCPCSSTAHIPPLTLFRLSGSSAEPGTARMVTAEQSTLSFKTALHKPAGDIKEATSIFIFYIQSVVSSGNYKKAVHSVFLYFP